MNNSKSSLFLMELIIVILFFSMSSAVCVQLFVRSHNIDQTTSEQTHASMAIQNYSETFYACNGSAEDMHNLLSHSEYIAEESMIYSVYDSDWDIIDLSESGSEIPYYIAVCKLSSDQADNDCGYSVSAQIGIFNTVRSESGVSDLSYDPTVSDTETIADSLNDLMADSDYILMQEVTDYIQLRKGDAR